MKDIGKLMGKYFFVLAFLNIITILIGFYQSGNLFIELGGLIFLIGEVNHLFKNLPRAEKWL